jgi:hypothetical protein
MTTVMKMNEVQEGEEGSFSKNLRTKFGLKSSTGKKSAIKKRKVIKENGMAIVAIDEDMAKKASKVAKADPGSIQEGKSSLAWMIHPMSVDKFFSETWERRPLHIKRRGATNVNHYKNIFSTKMFEEILKTQVRTILLFLLYS